LVALLVFVSTACTSSPKPDATALKPAGPMREILESHPGLAAVVARAAELRLQAVLGTIEPGPDGRPRLRQHGFRLGAEYFYPASTVKLFAAVAVLERLGESARTAGLDVGPGTPLVYYPLFDGEEREDSDPTNLEGGAITVRHEIRKLFLVSDNAAFNRVYELVGQDGLAASMQRAGLRDARIVHRLSDARSAEENRRYPRDRSGRGRLRAHAARALLGAAHRVTDGRAGARARSRERLPH
jgi:cell division protein FtsI/penicillin-binding protein 2